MLVISKSSEKSIKSTKFPASCRQQDRADRKDFSSLSSKPETEQRLKHEKKESKNTEGERASRETRETGGWNLFSLSFAALQRDETAVFWENQTVFFWPWLFNADVKQIIQGRGFAWHLRIKKIIFPVQTVNTNPVKKKQRQKHCCSSQLEPSTLNNNALSCSNISFKKIYTSGKWLISPIYACKMMSGSYIKEPHCSSYMLDYRQFSRECHVFPERCWHANTAAQRHHLNTWFIHARALTLYPTHT